STRSRDKGRRGPHQDTRPACNPLSLTALDTYHAAGFVARIAAVTMLASARLHTRKPTRRTTACTEARMTLRLVRFPLAAFALIAGCGMVFTPALAVDFYRGKTLSIVVGFTPGGGFDLNARLLSRHLPRHI